jgi:tetratricopeptide (TPR) repeat protein
MDRYRAVISSCLPALVFIAGCSGMEVGHEFQAGRKALQTGQTEQAVVYLSRAAEADPTYKIVSPVQENLLTYLGRAYYETGGNAKARAVLERTLTNDPNDPLAHLYLGLTLYRGGDRLQGRKEIEIGLNGLHSVLDVLSGDGEQGTYWDPNRTIRLAIERTLAGKPEAGEFSASAQRIGRQFDNEIDRARITASNGIYKQGGRN